VSRRSVVKAVGHYLPAQVLTNKALESRVETTDEWIRERTGIAQRHVAAENEYTSDLAAKAAQAALRKAGMTAGQIDLIIVATTTPDETFPATACRVQEKIGANGCVAFDMQAACSGFVYGLALAEGMLQSGQAKTALVIGAETYSRLIDWSDRGTCILFGDGAGAMILQAEEGSERGILSLHLAADGGLADILKTTGGVSSTQAAGRVYMQGREVFRHAVQKMADSLVEAMARANLSLEQIDWLVPHQANARILTAIAEKLNLPADKVIMTMDRHANTSAASIPLALSVADDEGKLKTGHLVAMPALGAGLTWGTCILRW
jgi:3-oxoacyl-[acyl-carrier-protein] synthase III